MSRAAAGTPAKRRSETEQPRPRGAGAQFVYDALKRDIIDMVLPPGAPVEESRLAERFRLSRTPIREALVRLASEGLVTTLPNRNTVVSAIDFTALGPYFDALMLMYRVTTRLAAVHRSEADLVLVRACQADFARSVAAEDALAMITVNRDFHIAIANAGRNAHFTGLFARLLDEGRRLLRVYYSSYNDRLPQRFVEEHDRIIEAIAARDPDRADALAGDHAAQVVQQLQNFLTPTVGASLSLRGLGVSRPEPEPAAGPR